MAVSFKWLGHSAFLLTINEKSVLIDPFLTDNPLGAADASDVPADVILLSHAHGDHLGDTVAIAKRTGSPVISNFEIGTWLMNQGVENVVQMNSGGAYTIDGLMQVKLTIAFHTSSFPDGTYGGMPHGFLMTLENGFKIYYAGDTALFSDMQLIGASRLDLAFLPIGDHFTMGLEDSIQAIKWLNPRLVVPMHYNTFPPIVQNANEWATRVNNETNAVPIVLDPGNSYTVSQ